MPALADQLLQHYDQSSIALTNDLINQLLNQLDGWQLSHVKGVNKITKTYKFTDFLSALAFANAVALLAEQQNHHPSICFEWGKTSITWWTHKVSGLFINDFIMAARCDRINNDEIEP